MSFVDPSKEKDLTQTHYIIPNQPQAPKPEFDLKNENAEFEDISLPPLDQLEAILAKLHLICCINKGGEKRDYLALKQLSDKILTVFSDKYSALTDELSKQDIEFLESTYYALDFKRLYDSSIEDKKKYFKMTEEMLTLSSKAASQFKSKVTVLSQDLQELYNSLEFEIEFEKVSSKLFCASDELEIVIGSINIQTDNLETGESLDYSTDKLNALLEGIINYQKAIQSLLEISKDRRVQLGILKQANLHISNAFTSIELFIHAFKNEIQFELKNACLILDQPLDEEIEENADLFLRYSKAYYTYSTLQRSYEKLNAILIHFSEAFDPFLKPETHFLGHIQAWTATLFSLPASTLRFILHPTESFGNLDQFIESEKGRIQHRFKQIKETITPLPQIKLLKNKERYLEHGETLLSLVNPSEDRFLRSEINSENIDDFFFHLEAIYYLANENHQASLLLNLLQQKVLKTIETLQNELKALGFGHVSPSDERVLFLVSIFKKIIAFVSKESCLERKTYFIPLLERLKRTFVEVSLNGTELFEEILSLEEQLAGQIDHTLQTNYQVIEKGSDGNCLLYSLDELNDNTLYLRESLCRELIENKDSYLSIFEQMDIPELEGKGSLEEKFRLYISFISQDKVHLDYLAIVALSNLYDRQIIVVEKSEDFFHLRSITNQQITDAPPIILKYSSITAQNGKGIGHYQLLKNVAADRMLPSKELALRSRTQKQACKDIQESKNWDPDKLTLKQKIFLASVSILYIGEACQWGLRVYEQSSTMAKRSEEYKRSLFRSLDKNVKREIEKDASIFERFLDDHLKHQKPDTDYSEWIGFKKRPALAGYVKKVQQSGTIHSQETSQLVENFVSWQVAHHFQSPYQANVFSNWIDVLNPINPFSGLKTSIQDFLNLFTPQSYDQFNDQAYNQLMLFSKYGSTMTFEQRGQFQVHIEKIYENFDPRFNAFEFTDKQSSLLFHHIEAAQRIIVKVISQNPHYPSEEHIEKLSEDSMIQEPYRELAHITGEAIARKSLLEGNTLNKQMEHILTFLKKQISLNQNYFPTKSLYQTLSFSYKFNSEFFHTDRALCNRKYHDLLTSTDSVCFTDEERKAQKELRNILVSYLNKLQVGQPLLVQGGWYGNPGHAISFEIIKEPNNLFTFRVSNRGSGSEYHPTMILGDKINVFSHVQKKGIAFEDITQDAVVAFLFESRQHEPFDQLRANFIYQGLFSDSVLPGKLYQDTSHLEEWVHPQLSGICSYASLALSIKNHFPENQFLRFEAELSFWTLATTFNSHLSDHHVRKNKLEEERMASLILKSVFTFSNSLLNSLEKQPDLFTKNELKQIWIKLEEINKTLQSKLKEGRVKQYTTSKLQLAITDSKAPYTEKAQLPNSLSLFGIEDKKNTENLEEFSYFQAPPFEERLIAFDWTPKLETITSDLKLITRDLKAFYFKSNREQKNAPKFISEYRSTKREEFFFSYVYEISEKLIQLDFSSLNKEERLEVIESVNSIHKQYFVHFTASKTGSQIHPKRYLASLRLAKIMHSLVSEEIADELGFIYPLNFLFSGIQFIDSAYFTAEDPKVFEEIREIQKLSNAETFHLYEDSTVLTFESELTINENSDLNKLHTLPGKITQTEEIKALLKLERKNKNFLFHILIPSLLYLVSGPLSHKFDPSDSNFDRIEKVLRNEEEIEGMLIPKTWHNLIDFAVRSFSLVHTPLKIQDGFNLGFVQLKEREETDFHTSAMLGLGGYPSISCLQKQNGSGAKEYHFRIRWHCQPNSYSSSLYSKTFFKNFKNNFGPTYQNLDEALNSQLRISHLEGHLFEQNHPLVSTPEIIDLLARFEKQTISNVPLMLHTSSSPTAVVKERFYEKWFRPLDEEIRELDFPLKDDELIELRSILLHPSLMLDRLMDYFSNPLYTRRIRNRDFKTLINVILFSRTTLANQLMQPKEGKQLAYKLAQFTKNQYEKYLANSDYESAIFYLGLSQKIARYANYYLSEEDFSSVKYLNTKEILKDLLSKNKLNSSEKVFAQIHYFIAATEHLELLTHEEGIDLFRIYFEIKMNFSGLKFDTNRPFFPQEFALIEERLYALIYKAKNHLSEAPSFYINRLLADLNFYDSSQNDEWTVSEYGFPVFECSKKKLIVDLYRGSISSTSSQGVVKALPDFITENPQYKELFGDESYNGLVISDQVFIFKDKNNYLNRLIKKSDEIVFQRQFDSRWFWYLKPSLLVSVPDKIIRLPSSILVDGYTHWASGPSNYEMHIFKKGSETIYAIAAKEGSSDSNQESKVLRLEQNDYLTSIDHTSLQFLKRFEEAENIGIWSNEEGVTEVQFSRMQLQDGSLLSFSKEGSRLLCNNYPNLYLSSKNDFLFNSNSNVIFLENAKGEVKKALFSPFLQLKKDIFTTKSSLNKEYDLEVPFYEKGKPVEVIEFDLEGNPLFKPSSRAEPSHNVLLQTTEQKLFWCFQLLKNQDYDRAISLIKDMKSSFHGFSAKETSLLIELIRIQKNTNDFEPKALAAYMHIFSLYIDLAVRLQSTVWGTLADQIELIKSTYEQYLKVREYAPLISLSPADELNILRLVRDEDDPILLNREKTLLSELGDQIDLSSVYSPLFLFNNAPLGDLQIDMNKFDRNLNYIFKHGLLGIKDIYKFPPFLTLFNLRSMGEQFLKIYELILENSSIDGNGSHSPVKQNLQRLALLGAQQRISGGPEYPLWYLLLFVSLEPNRFPSAHFVRTVINNYLSEDNTLGDKKELSENGKQLDEMIDLFINQSRAVFEAHKHSFNKGLQFRDQRPVVPYKASKTPKQAPTCLELRSDYPLHAFRKAAHLKLMHMFVKETKLIESSMYEEATLGLKPFFDKDSPSLFEEKIKADIAADIKSYTSSEVTTRYELTNTNLFSLKQILTSHIESGNLLLENLSKKIIAFANKPLSEDSEDYTHLLQIKAEKAKELTLDDLFLLFIQNDSNAYLALNPNLTRPELKQLHKYLHEYLSLSTLKNQQKAVLKIVKDIETSSPERKEEKIQLLGEIGLARRAYDIQSQPEYLVFEYYSEILLYPRQVKKLKELKAAAKQPYDEKNLGLIIEAIMGFGKSKVLLPLLSLYLADGKKVPMIVMPDSLAESLGHELKESTHPFKHKIKLIEFNRNSDVSAEKLSALILSIRDAIHSRDSIMISSSSLQSLFLKYIESLYLFSEKSYLILGKSIPLFQELFGLLKTKGLPIFDEADLLFNCRLETHFTLSTSTFVRSAHLDLSIMIYEIISQDHDFKPFGFEFNSNDEESAACSLQRYHNEMKPLLAKKVIEKILVKKDPRFDSKALGEFCQQLKESDLKVLESYLAGENSKKAEELLSSIHDETLENVITLAQAQLNTFAPLTLNKKILEHYGPPQTKDKTLAIPFHHGKASERSDFGNHYEVINYSIQYYLKNGISKEIIKSQVLELKRRAQETLSRYPSLSLLQLEEFSILKSIIPGATNFDLSDEQLHVAAYELNTDKTKILFFIRKFIIDEVKVYRYRISTNPQIFKILFQKILGFTGTLWNAETFPTGLSSLPSKGIIGKTITQIMLKSSKEIKVLQDEAEAHLNLQTLIKGKDTSALIDLDGFYDHIDRLELCKKILEIKKEEGYKGVAFYDITGKLVVLENPDIDPVLFEHSDLKNKPSERFTLYDHQRTTGADVSQAPSARALLSFGRHTILRDLLQAAWRMRGLGKRQAIDFIIMQNDRKIILEFLNLNPSHELTLEHLIEYAILNQIEKKGADNVLSTKQKLSMVILKHAFHLLQSLPIDNTPHYLADSSTLFMSFENLFITEIVDQPKDQFKQVEELTPSEEVISQYIQEITRQYQSLFSPAKWGLIIQEMNEVVQLDHIPLEIRHSEQKSELALEREVELAVEQETNVEQEVSQETEQMQDIEASVFQSDCKLTPSSWEKFLKYLSKSSSLSADVIAPKPINFFKVLTDSTNHLTIARLNPFLNQKIAYFSSNILASSQLIFGFKVLEKSINDPYQVPKISLYETCQAPAQEALCFQTPRGIQILMLSIEEAEEWKRMLHTFDETSDYKFDFQFPLFLFNIETGLVEGIQSRFESQTNDIIQSTEFETLRFQTKILSGRLNLSDKEIELFKAWVTKEQISKLDLYNFMVDEVLSSSATLRASFKVTQLGRFLKPPTDFLDYV